MNGGVAVRQLYLRHLERWERARGTGGAGGGTAGGDDGGGDEGDDDRPRRAAWGTPKPRNTVAHTYNHNQHNVPGELPLEAPAFNLQFEESSQNGEYCGKSPVMKFHVFYKSIIFDCDR